MSLNENAILTIKNSSMKKKLILLLTVIFVLSLSVCAQVKSKKNNNGVQNPTPLNANREELLEKFPKADMNKDGKLNSSELWYINTLAKKEGDKELVLTTVKLLNSEYKPSPINETQKYKAPNGKKIKLFILSGQSNMLGQGLSKELEGDFPEALVPNERILMYENGKWQPLQPLIITFGPEIKFAHEMAKAWPNETIGIVKQSQGGTGIMAWIPQRTKDKTDYIGEVNKGNLWIELTQKVKDAQKAAPCETVGFVWMQGAKDMKKIQTAEAYLGNLDTLFSALRREVNSPKLPIVLGSYRMNGLPDKIDDSNITEELNPSEKLTILVLKAQWDIQTLAPPTKTIPLRDLEQHPKPNVHYNTKGQLQLGEKFARGYLQLVKSK